MHIKIKIEHWHPGVPDYDVSYRLQVYQTTPSGKEARLTTAQYDLSCDEAPLIFRGNTVTVPAVFKDNTDKVTVTIKATTRDPEPATAEFQLPIKNWKLTLNEDFEGDTLNDKLWTSLGSWGLTDLGGVTIANSTESLRVHDSMLTIFYQKANGRETKLRDGRVVKPDVFSSSVDTVGKFEQQFGCYRCSMRIASPETASGACNPAFWLMPPTVKWGEVYLFTQIKGRNAGMGCGEIDIIEYSPQWTPPQYQITDHWWSAPGKGHFDDEAWHYDDSLWDGKFHDYFCVWTESDLYYYFDGVLVKEQHNLQPTGLPAKVMLSLGSAGHKTANTTWIGHFDIDDLEGMTADFDYVKVYK